jgi:hypothetical protein
MVIRKAILGFIAKLFNLRVFIDDEAASPRFIGHSGFIQADGSTGTLEP